MEDDNKSLGLETEMETQLDLLEEHEASAGFGIAQLERTRQCVENLGECSIEELQDLLDCTLGQESFAA